MDVNSRYPGSSNDAFSWSRSNIQNLLRNLHETGHKDYYLLGGSGYPLRPWLLIPIREDPLPNTPEFHYNVLHKNARSGRLKIECCKGVLKGRFRCLLKHRVLHYSPINACVVLHNMCISYNIPEPDPEIGDEDIDFGILMEAGGGQKNGEHLVGRVNPELAEGRRTQLRIIDSLYRARQ